MPFDSIEDMPSLVAWLHYSLVVFLKLLLMETDLERVRLEEFVGENVF